MTLSHAEALWLATRLSNLADQHEKMQIEDYYADCSRTLPLAMDRECALDADLLREAASFIRQASATEGDHG